MSGIRKMQSKNPPTVSAITINTTIAPNGPGSLIVVWVGVSDLSAFNWTFVDNAGVGQVWTPFTSSPIVGSAAKGYAYWTITKTTKMFTITATKDGGGVFMNMLLDEFTGIDINNPVIVTAVAQGSTASPTTSSPSVTPDVDRALIWAAINDSVVGSLPGANFTKGADDSAQDISEWRVLGDETAGIATTATFPTAAAGAYTLAVAAFRPAPGGYPQLVQQIRPNRFQPGLSR